jgi:hypothetical protein
MEVITLKVQDVVSARGILESSLKRELFLLDKSIGATRLKLKDFEARRGMRSEEFYENFEQGLAGDDQDAMLWTAEYEALNLLEKERSIIQQLLNQCTTVERDGVARDFSGNEQLLVR